MREQKFYYCEYCNTPYTSKKDALSCEESHKTPKKIITNCCNYKPIRVGPAWPFKIRVEDQSGDSCEYIYNGHEK